MKEILYELKEIKKELQDIRSILEPKETSLKTTRNKIGETDVVETTILYPKEWSQFFLVEHCQSLQQMIMKSLLV